MLRRLAGLGDGLGLGRVTGWGFWAGLMSGAGRGDCAGMGEDPADGAATGGDELGGTDVGPPAGSARDAAGSDCCETSGGVVLAASVLAETAGGRAGATAVDCSASGLERPKNAKPKPKTTAAAATPPAMTHRRPGAWLGLRDGIGGTLPDTADVGRAAGGKGNPLLPYPGIGLYATALTAPTLDASMAGGRELPK